MSDMAQHIYGSGSVGPIKNYNYGIVENWQFCYQTQKDDAPGRDPNHPTPDNPESRPWLAFALKPIGKGAKNGSSDKHQVVKARWFATRASAKRCAERWARTHEKRRKTQRRRIAEGYISPGQLCPKCESNKRLKDYYLCADCV
jgi:hypothetical protein